MIDPKAIKPGDEVTSHSPAPWKLEVGDHTHRYVLVTDARDLTVMYKYASGAPKDAVQDEANARLIAAAPDLLEALKEACEIIHDLSRFANNNGGMIDDETFPEGLAAIAKATGAPQ